METSKSSAAQCLEGMESGSIDRFQLSDGVMRMLAPQTVTSEWPPAHSFWGVFQVFDPGGIFPIAFQTPASFTRYLETLHCVGQTVTVGDRQEGERRKVIACAALAWMIYKKEDNPGEAVLNELRVALKRIIELDSIVLMATDQRDHWDVYVQLADRLYMDRWARYRQTERDI